MTSIIVSEETKGLRLDKLLSLQFPEWSRTYFQRLIDDGFVLVNGSPLKKKEKPDVGDEIEICFQLTPEISLAPENIPLDILYEDDYIIAVNKPAGMVVHPAPGHHSGTFVNALLYHCKHLPGGDLLRPGLVHRLDKETSGVILAAKTLKAHTALIELFSTRKISKKYLAICLGPPPLKTVSEPILRHPTRRKEMTTGEGGRPAITHFTLLEKQGELSLIEAAPITGRTHQIRVHLKYLKTPVLGDSVYGSPSINQKYGVLRQMLHAHTLSFPHPITREPITLTAPVPADFSALAKKFSKSS